MAAPRCSCEVSFGRKPKIISYFGYLGSLVLILFCKIIHYFLFYAKRFFNNFYASLLMMPPNDFVNENAIIQDAEMPDILNFYVRLLVLFPAHSIFRNNYINKYVYMSLIITLLSLLPLHLHSIR